MALWLPSGTQLHIDAAVLRKQLFAGRLPWSEKYRNYYGAAMDLERIEASLRMAEVGIMVELADLGREALRYDPHVSGVAPKRFGAIRSLPWTVTPAAGPDVDKKLAVELADELRAVVEQMRGFRQALYDIAWGVFDGRAALEIDWQWFGGRSPYKPVALDWIHPRRLGYGPNRELRVIETFMRVGWFEPVGYDLGEIPGKFITWTPRYWSDYPEFEGLNPRTVYWTFMKKFSAKMRMVLMELFALPWRTLESDKDAPVQKEDIEEAAEIAEALGSETTAGFPPGVRAKIHWPGENNGELMNLSIEGIDSQLSRLWLGNEATTVAKGGALGSTTAETHKGEQNIYLDSDGEGITERIQEQLFRPYVLLNRGPDALPSCPRFELKTKPEKDRAAEQKRYNDAISMGVPVAVHDYYEASGIRPPEKDEPVIVLVERPLGVGGLPRTKIVDPSNETDLDELQREGPPPNAEKGTSPRRSEVDILGDDEPDEEEEDAPPAGALGLARLGLIVLAQQPDRGNGSPEDIIARGTREGSRITQAWSGAFVAAVDGLTRETTIYRALEQTAKELPLDPFAAITERTLIRSFMLGALDAALEAENDTPIELPFMSSRQVLLAAVPDFVRKPFQDAIAFFIGKKIMTRRAFDRLRAEAKRQAFTIAGLARKAMLDVAHAELTKSISDGTDLRSFAKALASRFASAGWLRLKPSHVELVFRNATMGAYATGRDQQMRQPEVLAARPYWQILGVNDDRTRATHAHAHRKVLLASDPFWTRAPLPWGHNCRCRKISRSERDLKRLGLVVVDGSALSGLPDPGWDTGSLLVA
jgi:phage gp29-like protein